MLEEVGTILRLENGTSDNEEREKLEGEAAKRSATELVKRGLIKDGKARQSDS